MRFLAIDPGLTTGMAEQTDTLKLPLTWELPVNDAMDLVEELLDGPRYCVVMESFTPRPGVRTWQPDALEAIGVARFLARKNGCLFELQSPADAKRFSTDEKLKKLGWHTPTEGGHANDALRHLLLGRVRHQDIDLGAIT